MHLKSEGEQYKEWKWTKKGQEETSQGKIFWKCLLGLFLLKLIDVCYFPKVDVVTQTDSYSIDYEVKINFVFSNIVPKMSTMSKGWFISDEATPEEDVEHRNGFKRELCKICKSWGWDANQSKTRESGGEEVKARSDLAKCWVEGKPRFSRWGQHW